MVLLEKCVLLTASFREIEGAGFENRGGKGEFFGEFLLPLRPESGWQNQEDASFSFGPSLSDDDGRFDGLAETHFIGQNCTLGQWGTDSEQGSVNLMGIQVNLGVGDGLRQAIQTPATAAQRQRGGPI